MVKTFIDILENDYPELLDSKDYRVTEWAVRKLKVICSNLLHDIKNDYSELHEGGVVWVDEGGA